TGTTLNTPKSFTIKQFMKTMENISGLNYFQNNEPSKWSLIGFLKWRSETQQFLDSKREHSAFKYFLQELATDENNTNAKRAQESLNNWKKIKHSPEVKKFWNDYRTQNLQQDLQYVKAQNELKTLQVETEDNDNGRTILDYRELSSSYKRRENESSNNNKQPNIKEKTSAIRPTKKMKSSGQTESENNPIPDVECGDIETFLNDDYTDDQSIDNEYTDDEFTEDEFTDDKLNMASVEKSLKKFKEAYLLMDPNYMWTLKTGRKVEKVIYDFAKNLNRESYLHSFIINDADVDTKNLFTPDEWKEIKNLELVERPKLDPCHKELLIKYTVMILKNCDHFSLNHLYLMVKNTIEAFISVLILLTMDIMEFCVYGKWMKICFDSLKLEGWFGMNVWSRIIDPVVDDLNIDLIRGEGMSFASSERKNIHRKINNRKNIGRKGDGIFRLRRNRLEFGAVEAGRKWEEINGTKYMTDSLKISKMLKDMLDKLIIECKMKEDLVKKLKVIGILHGANRLQVLTGDHPFGYITRINRNNIQEVSGRLTNSKPLALVLKEILYARSVIIATMDAVEKKNDLNLKIFLDDDNDDEYHTPLTNTVTNTFITPVKSNTKDMTKMIKHSIRI
ncbi:6608_t:CDS:2, partial [Entrophospora sp. SA101]